MPLSDLIDLAINQTLARTIMTSLTLLLALGSALLLRRRGDPLVHRRDDLGHRSWPPPRRSSSAARSSSISTSARRRPTPADRSCQAARRPEPRWRASSIRAAHYPGRAPIDAYGNGGFRFAGMSHRGSLLCLPSGIYGWDAAGGRASTASTLGRSSTRPGRIEVLLVGTGASDALLARALRSASRARHRCRAHVDRRGGAHLQRPPRRGARGRRGAGRGGLSRSGAISRP